MADCSALCCADLFRFGVLRVGVPFCLAQTRGTIYLADEHGCGTAFRYYAKNARTSIQQRPNSMGQADWQSTA